MTRSLLPRKTNDGFSLSSIDRFFNHFQDALDQDLRSMGLSQIEGLSQTDFVPLLDINVYVDKYEISLETPGVSKDDLSVYVTNDNKLVLEGEKNHEESQEDTNVSIKERIYGKFHREVQLPPNTETDQINVRYRNGVLYVIAPKEGPEEQQQQYKKLEIQ